MATQKDIKETTMDNLALIKAFPNGIEAQEDDALELLKVHKAALDKVVSAKPSAFKKAESDFWPSKEQKATASEKHPATIQGIYLGNQRRGRYLIHAVGSKDSKGKPLAVRINGTAILTRELLREENAVGKGVRISYLGGSKTDEGQKLSLFQVEWFE